MWTRVSTAGNFNTSRFGAFGTRQRHSQDAIGQPGFNTIVVDIVTENEGTEKMTDLVFLVQDLNDLVGRLANSPKQRQFFVLNLQFQAVEGDPGQVGVQHQPVISFVDIHLRLEQQLWLFGSGWNPVSYRHLTLPTKSAVVIMLVAVLMNTFILSRLLRS